MNSFSKHPFGGALTIVEGGVRVPVINLFSLEGLHMIMTGLVENFTGFAPLGAVLVSLLGIGIAEGSGFIGTILRLIVLKSPAKLLTFVVVFAGVVSNMASEVGYVLLVPLAAVIFISAGRHPIAGLAAAFAGVSGGYSANLLLGSVDPLLSGISQEAARLIDPSYSVHPACNYYFMVVSTFIIAFLGTWVTEKFVEPRLGTWKGDDKPKKDTAIEGLTKLEKRGLLYAGIAGLILTAGTLIGLLPEDGFLRYPGGNVLQSPFMGGIIAVIFIVGAILGIAYGIGAKTFRNSEDVIKGMAKAMETLGAYIVLVFFAAQFVAMFNWSFMGIVVAVKGAHFLQAMNLSQIPLLIGLIMVAAMINLVMGSASAKWTIMAPVFIPMFMLLGYSPELVQLAYRIGDSTTNIISPMMSYFALIIAFVQQYDKKAGIGTIVSTMLPYSVVFFIGWVILLVIWVLLGWPIGPDAPLTLKP